MDLWCPEPALNTSRPAKTTSFSSDLLIKAKGFGFTSAMGNKRINIGFDSNASNSYSDCTGGDSKVKLKFPATAAVKN